MSRRDDAAGPRGTADRVVVADRIVTATGADGPGWLALGDGLVVDVGDGPAPTGDLVRLPLERLQGVVVPGFVDQHVHGALGVDFGGADEAGARRAAAHHQRAGSTRLVASVATASSEATVRALGVLAPLVEEGVLDGVHLEGPWLSVERRGAHDPGLLRSPEPAEVEALLEAARGTVRLVTIAPELPGAVDAIRLLVDRGVVVALGHSDCTAAEAHAAADAGATVVTHVYNGMRPLHHREPGLAGAALTDDRLAVELILDGQHVSRDAVEIARRASSGRLVLVSDAMAATGWSDGRYSIAGSEVVVEHGVAMLADGSSLAGSTGTVGAGVTRLVREHGVSLPEAVRASSATAAASLGLAGAGLGRGDRADLVVLDDQGRVGRVMRGGHWL
ncbi:N-acetylglucosamine-6-phosphate deacetylase [Frigoribacterium sp. PhB24]|uniref:N-acetylglucosamine-6-phosphate deacetylase n=1 Tax=Frigoribacterium sp. PhB24 TaxID=2485204 RepID=UPI000FC0048F|nr:N-acetylglucosamine-6-phosphate deacetylase [Frigoribacterium sp. PhB24]ROS52674.1 N-acetylglucosamine 6-phosphate deacetylase [Frigoribacterium sp. PhB24]